MISISKPRVESARLILFFSSMDMDGMRLFVADYSSQSLTEFGSLLMGWFMKDEVCTDKPIPSASLKGVKDDYPTNA